MSKKHRTLKSKYKMRLRIMALLVLAYAIMFAASFHIPDAGTDIDTDIVTIRFAATGDNLIHSPVYNTFKTSTGYDFTSLYATMTPYIKDADIACMNMETICAGSAYGLSTYPRFNGPTEVIDGVTSAGFNWLTMATNHTLDKGANALLSEIANLKTNYKDVTYTGVHDSEDDTKYRIITVNGVKIGLLNYTYGLNGFSAPAGMDYIVDLIDEDTIKTDMAALNKVSDLQVVAMHWGQEYHTEPNDTQKQLAALLESLGADMIIGNHPHVLQPVEILTGEDNHRCLCICSLGNFVSAQDRAVTMLGGLATWTVYYDKVSGDFAFHETTITPLVTQIEKKWRSYTIIPLKDYTDENAANHVLQLYKNVDMSKKNLENLFTEAMGNAPPDGVIYNN